MLGKLGLVETLGNHGLVETARLCMQMHARSIDYETVRMQVRVMFAVLFEVQPRKGHRNAYFDLAKQLKPKLEAIDGFIDNERFASKKTEGGILSLSTRRDGKAVVRWRSHEEHHGVQERDRCEVFEDYRLRVGEITADSAPPKGAALKQTRFDETQTGEAKVCTITEVLPKASCSGPGPDLVLAHLQLDPQGQGLLDHAGLSHMSRCCCTVQ